jgi:hypothetical protein
MNRTGLAQTKRGTHLCLVVLATPFPIESGGFLRLAHS